MPVGTYEISVSREGFANATRTGILVEIGSTTSVTISLRVGNASQEVTVTAEAPTLNQDTSDIGTVVNTKQVLDFHLRSVVWAHCAPPKPSSSLHRAPPVPVRQTTRMEFLYAEVKCLPFDIKIPLELFAVPGPVVPGARNLKASGGAVRPTPPSASGSSSTCFVLTTVYRTSLIQRRCFRGNRHLLASVANAQRDGDRGCRTDLDQDSGSGGMAKPSRETEISYAPTGKDGNRILPRW